MRCFDATFLVDCLRGEAAAETKVHELIRVKTVFAV
jgi:hypothetical protein